MIDRLIECIVQKKNPSIAGLDPRLEYIPDHILEKHCKSSSSFEAVAAAIYEFNTKIVDAIHEFIPAVKIQIACYEMYGIPGLEIFKATADYARKKGLVVIGDVKRNDIGSTANAYSSAYLGETPLLNGTRCAFPMDFITVNPYFGVDGIQPFLDDCKKFRKGVFILVKTSNPSSGEIQDLVVEDRKLYQLVGEKVSMWGKGLMGSKGYSAVGAVVGATYPHELVELRELMPKTFFLVPGYGAQGGSISDILGCFGKDGLGAVINASRSIICAYKRDPWRKQFKPEEFAEASRAEVLRMRDEIEAGLESKGIKPW